MIPKWITKLINNNVSLYDKYAYMRLSYSRGNSHLNMIMIALAKIPEFLILIKVFNIPLLLGIIIAFIFVILEFLLIIYIGHIDLQNRLMDRDIRLSNYYNPDIQEIKNSLKKR